MIKRYPLYHKKDNGQEIDEEIIMNKLTPAQYKK